MDEDLDADALAAARRMLARRGAAICPACGRREVPDSKDHCDPCTEELRNASRRDWWERQGDYRALLAYGHRPAEAAARWLAHRLRKGPVDAHVVRADATDQGIARRTLRRAREQLQADARLAVEKAGLPRGHARWRLTTRNER